MNRLRRDLRELFSRRQEGLGDVRQSSRQVLQDGLARRERPVRSRTQLAAGIAAAVIAVLVISTFLYARSNGYFRSTAASGPRTTPAPTIPYMIDADLLDASTGWRLTSNCNGGTRVPCAYFASATTDGGLSWSTAVKVGPSFDTTNGDAPRTIRFLNRQDGFVFGHRVAFVTHDGGEKWAPLDTQAPEYVAITPHGDRVWTISYPCAKGSGLIGRCVYQVRWSLDAGRTWSAPYSLPDGYSPSNIVPFGAKGMLISGGPSGGMLLTFDGGSNWRRINTRCAPNTFSEFDATADGLALIEICVSTPSGGTADKVLWVSSDLGQTWSRPNASPVDALQAASGSLVLLASTGRETAVVASNRSTIAITRDGGFNWIQVGPAVTGFQTLRFATASDGWAVDNDRNIWITRDGGEHWASPTVATNPAPKPTPLVGDTPAGVIYASMAYDPDHHVAVLFGGASPAGYGATTWTWDGSRWTSLSPSRIPPAREMAGMVWESSRHKVLLFGGIAPGGQALADTWEWDGADWTELHPAHSPFPRAPGAIAYDEGAHSVVIYSGRAVGSASETIDTWFFDGRDWTALSTPSPVANVSYNPSLGAAWSAAANGLVLVDFRPRESGLDVWKLGPSGWGSATRIGTGSFWGDNNVVAYDPARKLWLFYGSQSASADFAVTTFDGVNRFPRGTSTPHPVASGYGMASVYDPDHKQILVFGGMALVDGKSIESSELWAWDFTRWTRLSG